MGERILKNLPLVEVIFEVRWELDEFQPGLLHDPHYVLLLGRLSDRVEDEYPFHEQLPSASIPSEMVAGLVQHRFRVAEDQWPVVQIGPGVFTVNDTKAYSWSDFQQRISRGIDALFAAHPDRSGMRIQQISLRYINAFPVNFDKESIFDFLGSKLKTHVSLDPGLFHDNLSSRPQSFGFNVAFSVQEPLATLTVEMSRGRSDNRESLVWQNSLKSAGEQVPVMPEGLKVWIDKAHAVLEQWFFDSISDDFEEGFR